MNQLTNQFIHLSTYPSIYPSIYLSSFRVKAKLLCHHRVAVGKICQRRYIYLQTYAQKPHPKYFSLGVQRQLSKNFLSGKQQHTGSAAFFNQQFQWTFRSMVFGLPASRVLVYKYIYIYGTHIYIGGYLNKSTGILYCLWEHWSWPAQRLKYAVLIYSIVVLISVPQTKPHTSTPYPLPVTHHTPHTWTTCRPQCTPHIGATCTPHYMHTTLHSTPHASVLHTMEMLNTTAPHANHTSLPAHAPVLHTMPHTAQGHATHHTDHI